MPSSPKTEAALAHFAHACKTGRLPHALLVTGRPRRSGTEFVLGFLPLLFPKVSPDRFLRHPDIQWLEPEGKARQIKIEAVRELIGFLEMTSYESGSKAVVILFADRLNINAQNSLLKMLEEPPPGTYLILVTDHPSALLPTIRSRTQAVDVAEGPAGFHEEWEAAVMELLRYPPLRKGIEMLAWTDRLTEPLRQLKDLATEEEEARVADADQRDSTAGRNLIDGRVATRVKEMREEILTLIQLWQRDVMALVADPSIPSVYFPDHRDELLAQAEGLSMADAAARVDVVHEVRRLLEHNIRERGALLRMARAFSTPVR